MPFLLSAITGGAQTGFTSPTYTPTADNNPGNNGKQYLITAVGGTQTGVTTHTASDVFTISAWRPLSYKVAQFVSTTIFKRPPRNQYKIIVRKGLLVNSNFPKDIGIVTMTFEIPAGSETLDAPNIRAMVSASVGAFSQVSSGWGDSLVTGSI